MIVTIAGTPGSGKSSAAKGVAKRLGYEHFSVGDLMRKIAQERGVSLLEISKIAETDPEIDRRLDTMQQELGARDSIVFDSRLGYHFIPHSFKVFLRISPEVAAQRIFGSGRAQETENVTIEATAQNIRQRAQSERRRYRKYYGIDPYDESKYDLIIDTTDTTPDEVVERILAALPEGANK